MKLINIAQATSMTDAPPLSSYFTGAVEFVVVLVGGIAVLGILISGVMYIMAGGDSSRVQVAKKALTASIIGLAVALLSLIIVKTVIGFA